LDHFLGPETGIEDFSRCQYPEWGDFVNQKYCQKVQKQGSEAVVSLWRDGNIWFPQGPVPIRVEKRIVIRGDSTRVAIRYRLRNLHTSAVRILFGTEFNWNLLVESAPDRYYRIDDKEPESPALGSWGESIEVEDIRIVDEATGVFVRLHLTTPGRLWRFPIYTVSQSENGPEKIYQGSCLLPHCELDLAPQREWKMTMEIEIGDHGGRHGEPHGDGSREA
jgi:alpha-amylase